MRKLFINVAFFIIFLSSRPIDAENHFGNEHLSNRRVHRPTKFQLQTSETPTTVQHRNPYRPLNQWTNDQYPWRKAQHGQTKLERMQPMSNTNSQISDRTKVSLKPEIKEINEKRFHQIVPKSQSRHSPTSWSILSSDHPTSTTTTTALKVRPHPHLHVHLSESSTSPTSSEEFLDQTSITTPRTYRLIENNVQPVVQMKKFNCFFFFVSFLKIFHFVFLALRHLH